MKAILDEQVFYKYILDIYKDDEAENPLFSIDECNATAYIAGREAIAKS